jgi:hypothetical protein
MALIANVNRDPKKSKAFKPTDFNPYYVAKKPERERLDVTPETMKIFRKAAIGIPGLHEIPDMPTK